MVLLIDFHFDHAQTNLPLFSIEDLKDFAHTTFSQLINEILLGKISFEARYPLGMKDILLVYKDGVKEEKINAGKFKGLMGLLGFSF